MVVVVALPVTHLVEHAGHKVDSLDLEIRALAGSTFSTSSHLLRRGPLSVGTALEGRTTDAVPGTLRAARSSQSTRAGGRAGARAGTGAGTRAGARATRRGASVGGLGGGVSRDKDTRSRGLGRLGDQSRGSYWRRRRRGRGSTGGAARGASRRAAGRATRTSGVAIPTEARGASAGLAALSRKVVLVTSVLNVGTGVGETNINTLLGDTAVDIGDEHGREVRRALLNRLLLGNFVTLGRTTGHGKRGTVHVHLTVSDTVEPSPGEGIFARLNTFRDGVGELGSSGRAGTTRKVTINVGGASTFDRLDDNPLGVLRGLAVGGQTDLARSTTVNSATHESQGHRLADGGSVLFGDLVSVGPQLAREITAVRRERRVVESVLAVRNGARHHHVGIHGGGAE